MGAGLGWAGGEHDENDKLVLCGWAGLRAAGCGMRQLPVGLLVLSPRQLTITRLHHAGDKHLCVELDMTASCLQREASPPV